MNAYVPTRHRQSDKAAPLLGAARKQRPPASVGLPLFMQAKSGTSEVGARLQRQCTSASTHGENDECESSHSHKPLQAKLAIGASDDPLEQEADRVADQVLAAPRRGAADGAPPHIQRYAGHATAETAVAPASVDHVLGSSGRPLEPALRQDMEQRFAQDFSAVRVHTDATAERSAHEVNAHAYTVGRNVVFGAGQFAPTTPAGRRLLAHELAHVVQQSGADEMRYGQGTDKSGLSPIVRRAPTPLLAGVFQYGRSNFADRFDGEVDSRNHRVVLTMRLAINDAVNGDAPEVKWARINSFFAAAKAVIEQAWRSLPLGLKSPCMAEVYSVGVNVMLDYDNPHQTITLWGNQGERSNSTNWQLGDTKSKTRSTPVLLDPKKKPSPENIKMVDFEQVPVVHEFGHLMGLEHPLCSGSDERCYGLTFEQKNDLMGYGSAITPRDYQPHIRIMERYGQDHLPAICNVWKTALQ